MKHGTQKKSQDTLKEMTNYPYLSDVLEYDVKYKSTLPMEHKQLSHMSFLN